MRGNMPKPTAAFPVWRSALSDPGGTLARYRQDLALEATRRLLELFQAAGARLASDSGTFREEVERFERTPAEREPQIEQAG
jgi:hypothetical protein